MTSSALDMLGLIFRTGIIYMRINHVSFVEV